MCLKSFSNRISPSKCCKAVDQQHPRNTSCKNAALRKQINVGKVGHLVKAERRADNECMSGLTASMLYLLLQPCHYKNSDIVL